MRRRILLSNNGGSSYESVDLGLPSGIQWATCNIGAESETDYGNFYKWKDSKEWTNDDIYYTYTDTATEIMGLPWRMPTNGDYWELVFNTNFYYVQNFNGSGVNGLKVENKNDASKYIFFPFNGHMEQQSGHIDLNVGYYWTSSGNRPNGMYCLMDKQGDLDPASNMFGWYGLLVRGVKDV